MNANNELPEFGETECFIGAGPRWAQLLGQATLGRAALAAGLTLENVAEAGETLRAVNHAETEFITLKLEPAENPKWCAVANSWRCRGNTITEAITGLLHGPLAVAQLKDGGK